MPVRHSRLGVILVALVAFAACALAETRLLEVPAYIRVWAYEPQHPNADRDGWRERPEANAEIRADEELLTSAATRAEIRLDFPNWLRVEESSLVSFPVLQAHQYFVEIEKGTVQYSQYLGSSADIRLRTPQALVVPLQNGRYEIQVGEDGLTQITVRDGSLRIYAEGEHRDLVADRMMRLQNADSALQFLEEKARPAGPWHKWNRVRDKEAVRLSGYRAARHDVLSAWRASLDAHGCWWTAIIDALD